MRANHIVSTIDSHAAGEPIRLITAGIPPLHGTTTLERRQELLQHHDHLRRTLLFEPRGHADMYGAILTPPTTTDADYGIIFLTNEGYSTMCGHGIIAVTTTLIETGMFPTIGPETVIGYDAPAGFIRAHATVADGRVTSVRFRNVPSFVMEEGITIETSVGRLTVDVSWGGASYALVEASALGLDVIPEQTKDLTRLGMEIKHAVEAATSIRHPDHPELHGLYGTIISEAPRLPGSDGRNITIYAEGAVDRSPCGTGTSAKLAWLWKNGKIGLNQPYVHESVISTTFTGTVVGETTYAGRPAVDTDIAGRGFITGLHQFLVDDADPTSGGFLVR